MVSRWFRPYSRAPVGLDQRGPTRVDTPGSDHPQPEHDAVVVLGGHTELETAAVVVAEAHLEQTTRTNGLLRSSFP